MLQEKEYERLGSTTTVKADVRIIAATHRDLEQMIRQGRFREDLFYRLNVVPIRLPPLRARREDIALLARHFCGIRRSTANREQCFRTPPSTSSPERDGPGTCVSSRSAWSGSSCSPIALASGTKT